MFYFHLVLLRSEAQTWNESSCSANIFPQFSLSLRYRLQDFQQLAYSAVLHHNGASFLYIFVGPNGNLTAWMGIILQPFWKRANHRKTCAQSDSITVRFFFRFWYSSVAVFSDLK
jgi:hypothetical protein